MENNYKIDSARISRSNLEPKHLTKIDEYIAYQLGKFKQTDKISGFTKLANRIFVRLQKEQQVDTLHFDRYVKHLMTTCALDNSEAYLLTSCLIKLFTPNALNPKISFCCLKSYTEPALLSQLKQGKLQFSNLSQPHEIQELVSQLKKYFKVFQLAPGSCLNNPHLTKYYALDSYTHSYAGQNGVRKHTQAVLNNFKHYFAANFEKLTSIEAQLMQNILELHDIGKGLDANTSKQHLNSKNVLKLEHNTIGASLIALNAISAIITQDALGKVFQGQLTIAAGACELNNSYVKFKTYYPNLSRQQFFSLMEVYYTCDAMSYPHLEQTVFYNYLNLRPHYAQKLEQLASAFEQFAIPSILHDNLNNSDNQVRYYSDLHVFARDLEQWLVKNKPLFTTENNVIIFDVDDLSAVKQQQRWQQLQTKLAGCNVQFITTKEFELLKPKPNLLASFTFGGMLNNSQQWLAQHKLLPRANLNYKCRHFCLEPAMLTPTPKLSTAIGELVAGYNHQDKSLLVSMFHNKIELTQFSLDNLNAIGKLRKANYGRVNTPYDHKASNFSASVINAGLVNHLYRDKEVKTLQFGFILDSQRIDFQNALVKGGGSLNRKIDFLGKTIIVQGVSSHLMVMKASGMSREKAYKLVSNQHDNLGQLDQLQKKQPEKIISSLVKHLKKAHNLNLLRAKTTNEILFLPQTSYSDILQCIFLNLPQCNGLCDDYLRDNYPNEIVELKKLALQLNKNVVVLNQAQQLVHLDLQQL